MLVFLYGFWKEARHNSFSYGRNAGSIHCLPARVSDVSSMRSQLAKKRFDVVVQSLSHVWLFASPWTVACQASLSFTVSQSLLKLMSIESVMPSNHLILCCPLLLLPSIFPIINVFCNELALCIRWPKYWSFSISPPSEYSDLDFRFFNENIYFLDCMACGILALWPGVGHMPSVVEEQILTFGLPW